MTEAYDPVFRQNGYEAGIDAAKKVVAEALEISLSQPPSLPAHFLLRTQAGWIIEELDRIKASGP